MRVGIEYITYLINSDVDVLSSIILDFLWYGVSPWHFGSVHGRDHVECKRRIMIQDHVTISRGKPIIQR
jgi:hypothetical protein